MTLHRESKDGQTSAPVGRGISWVAMLAWILVAFLVAGMIAYRLVTPFFHHG
jgi:hypothetical protein